MGSVEYYAVELYPGVPKIVYAKRIREKSLLSKEGKEKREKKKEEIMASFRFLPPSQPAPARTGLGIFEQTFVATHPGPLWARRPENPCYHHMLSEFFLGSLLLHLRYP